MATVFELKGAASMINKLVRTQAELKRKVGPALIKAGQYLQGESQEICPVQTGILHDSAFTRRVGEMEVVVGYTADYAAYVHEVPNAAHGKAFNIKHADKIATARVNHPIWFNRGQNQQWKFLETPAKTKRAEILAIIADGIK